MATTQTLVPNLTQKILLVFVTVVLATVGMFERRQLVVLKDGTELTGKVQERTDRELVLERPSGAVMRIPFDRIAKETWFNVDWDLNLGLDLKGGTSLRYRLEELPQEDGQTSAGAPTSKEIIDQAIETFNERLDKFGVKEISMRPSYEAREIIIELPGVSMEESETYEQIIQSLGHLEFRIVVSESTAGLNLEEERRRVQEYLEQNPDWTPRSIDLTRFDVQGPGNVIYRWFPWSQKSIDEGEVPREFPFSMLQLDPSEEFTGKDIDHTFPSSDKNGRPAVGFAMRPHRAGDFGAFTESHIDQLMAIVLDGEISSAPRLNSRIDSSGIIEGGMEGFQPDEEKALRTVLASGSLVVKPKRLSKATIGPTLGEASIDRGVMAGIVSMIGVLAFVLLLYRATGVIAALTLILGTYLLVGSLGFLGATLTLPGIAGILLTVGMAVDQNILINERIREERDKGKTIFQSVKNGFERAFVTIVDAQATTFIAGFALYKWGSGPIRGFAVTLMLGIIVTMFSAIVGSKILFAISLERDWLKHLRMIRVLHNLSVSWTRYMARGFVISAIITVAGIAIFAFSYESMKGLDFSGGFQVAIRLREPRPQPEVLETVTAKYPTAQVVSMLGVEGSGDAEAGKGARSFLIKIPADNAATASADFDVSDRYLSDLEEMFGELMIPEGIEDLEIRSDEGARTTNARFQLNLTGPVATDVVETRLRDRMAVDSVTPAGGEGAAEAASFEVAAQLNTVATEDAVRAAVVGSLSDLPNRATLSDPVPESQFIGASVGKELRNNAIIAIAIAVLGILIYIRLRFNDLRWGLAACIAAFHDALLGVGTVALFVNLGLVSAEVDLAMIGAFLTLIGYSLNDTIVVFDRIRENLPRVDRPLREVVDLSINQTLSRTILTGLTTLIPCAALFAFNYGQRNVLEGFAFIMGAGIFIGTFSTIFIASPIMLWLTERKARAVTSSATNKAAAAS